MSAENQNRIPISGQGSPSPLSSDAPQPIPLSGGDSGNRVEPSSRIRTFQSTSKLGATGTEFKRPLNTTGHGATRVRTFHAKLTDGAMSFLDQVINEWLDENPDIEVKFANVMTGMVEGKQRPEPNLIVSVWY